LSGPKPFEHAPLAAEQSLLPPRVGFDATKLSRFRAITLTDELNYAFTLIDLLAKQCSQIATLSSENILPDWLITEKGQRIRHQLTSTA